MSLAHHNYAPSYARHLRHWLERGATPTIVEVGILRGSGLAIWCELFPRSMVVGLDIDLSHIRDNIPNLRRRGAFEHNEPELLHFDAYAPDTSELVRRLGGRSIDIVIDDGPHTVEAIYSTAAALRPLLAEHYTYFVEDNPDSLSCVAQCLAPAEVEVGSGGLIIAWS